MYLTEEELKVLKGLMVLRVLKGLEVLKGLRSIGVLRFKVFGGARRFFKKEPFRVQKKCVGRAQRHELNEVKDNRYPCYEATKIASAMESKLWRWRRVKEYYQDMFEPDWNNGIRAMRAMM